MAKTSLNIKRRKSTTDPNTDHQTQINVVKSDDEISIEINFISTPKKEANNG